MPGAKKVLTEIRISMPGFSDLPGFLTLKRVASTQTCLDFLPYLLILCQWCRWPS